MPDRPTIRRRRLLVALAGLVVVALGVVLWQAADGGEGGSGWLARLGLADDRPDDADEPGGTDRAGDDASRDDDGREGSGGADGADGADAGEGDDGDGLVTPAEVEPFLLRGSDLPVGWRVIELSPVEESGDGCLTGEAILPDRPRSSAGVAFRRGSDGPVLSNAVVDYLDAEAALAAFEEIRTALVACTERPAAGGQARLRPVSLDAGEAAVGASITVEAGDQRVVGELLYALEGRRVTSILVLGLDAAQIDIARPALDVVLERLRSG